MQYELNYIWVGPNNMPAEQLANLDKTRSEHPDAIINVWVMRNIIHSELKDHLTKYDYIQQDIDQLLEPNTAPNTFNIIQLLKCSTIWAGLSDILRFLILCRDRQESAPSKRFYMEADNVYPSDLTMIIRNKGFVFYAGVEIGFHVSTYFIDLDSEIGNWFKQGLRTHLERVLGDTILNPLLIGLIAANDLHAGDVMSSFGHIAYVIYIVMCRIPTFEIDHAVYYLDGMQFGDWGSWIDPNIKSCFKEGIVAALCCYRIAELVMDIRVNTNNENITNDIGDYSKLYRIGIPANINMDFSEDAINKPMFESTSSTQMYLEYERKYVKQWTPAYRQITDKSGQPKIATTWTNKKYQPFT